jgi:hypothetical protein
VLQQTDGPSFGGAVQHLATRNPRVWGQHTAECDYEVVIGSGLLRHHMSKGTKRLGQETRNDAAIMASTMAIKNKQPEPWVRRQFSLRSTIFWRSFVQVLLLILIMRAITPFLVSWVAVLQTSFGLPGLPHKRDAIDDFIAVQEPIALAGVLCNIGPSGCEAGGVPPGAVLASPSRSNPDCKCSAGDKTNP